MAATKEIDLTKIWPHYHMSASPVPYHIAYFLVFYVAVPLQ
jgi:hypothetical protein